MLGVEREDIVDAQWVDNGPGWVAVLLGSAEAVLALRPKAVDLDVGVVGPLPEHESEALELRAFFHKDGAKWRIRSRAASTPQWRNGCSERVA
jgi:predicted PhzF superfamily epimerase YddE/YHI9